jgi:hypothetical protein
MPHNVDLPTHRYVWVRDSYIYNNPTGAYVPAVWFGISSHPGRTFGCHVLLENGATVIDLPLVALTHLDSAETHPEIEEAVAWDAFGWDVQVYEAQYLRDLSVEMLEENHRDTLGTGEAWFAIDWVNNGWSNYPQQHKWLWVVAGDDGNLYAMPQDRLLFQEASFTDHYKEIPEGGIKRQKVVWSAEK